MNPIRILVADHHPTTQVGIYAILATQPDYEVLIEATTGKEVRQFARKLKPEIILLSLNFPDISSYDLVTHLQHETPISKIIILTDQEDELSVKQVCQKGIAGYILKTEPCQRIIEAVKVISQGGVWFSRPIMEKLMTPTTGQQQIEPLTTRELALLVELVAGKTDKQIAQTLGIGERTVRHLLKQICDKWGLDTRIEVAVQAVRAGLVK